MKITKQDIGRTVMTRDGQQFTLTGWSDDSVYKINSAPYCWTDEGFYMHSISEHSLDIVAFLKKDCVSMFSSYYGEDSSDYVSCSHEWVGSGFSGGSVWCKICDLDYNEKLHGDSGL